MIGQSPRHEKLSMGHVWIGPNGMTGPPWWRTVPAVRPTHPCRPEGETP